jgi:methylmalonyl-CoA/ethylmalonyl-CoA epimerase
MGVTKLDNIGVAARDVRTVATFLSEKVGLKVTPSYDTSPPAATVEIGDQYLYVFQTEAPSSQEPRSLALEGNPPGIDHISLTVDNVDQVYRSLRERGVDFDGEPQTDEEWGIRMVGFKDPEGNSYFLVQNP